MSKMIQYLFYFDLVSINWKAALWLIKVQYDRKSDGEFIRRGSEIDVKMFTNGITRRH